MLIFNVDQHRMTLIKCSATSILPAQTNWNAGLHQTGKGQGLSHSVIDGTLPGSHLSTLFQQLLHFGMDMEFFRIRNQTFC